MKQLEAEIAGPGPHDGMWFSMPASVVAMVLVTDVEPVGPAASLVLRRSAGVDKELLADMLEQIVDRLRT